MRPPESTNASAKLPDLAEKRLQLKKAEQEVQDAERATQNAKQAAANAKREIETARKATAGPSANPSFNRTRVYSPRFRGFIAQLVPEYGWELVEADAVLRSQLDLPANQGLVVVRVVEKGIAEQAGIKPNDVVLKLDDQPVGQVGRVKDLTLFFGKKPIQVSLIREGQPRQFTMTGPEVGKPATSTNYWVGVPVAPVDAMLRSHLTALPANSGLIATDVIAESPAAKAGLQKYDILTKLNDIPLTKEETLREQVQKSDGKEIKVEVLRAGKPVSLSLTPEKHKSSSHQVRTFVVTDPKTLVTNHIFSETSLNPIRLGLMRTDIDEALKSLSEAKDLTIPGLSPEQTKAIQNIGKEVGLSLDAPHRRSQEGRNRRGRQGDERPLEADRGAAQAGRGIDQEPSGQQRSQGIRAI